MSCTTWLRSVLVLLCHTGQPFTLHIQVTVSLGCQAVFLAGGRTRDVRPAALWVRSGDVVVLAGHARRCYHGESMHADFVLYRFKQGAWDGMAAVGLRSKDE